jgi:hypothetical protein
MPRVVHPNIDPLEMMQRQSDRTVNIFPVPDIASHR